MSGPTGTRSSETSTLDSRRRLKPRSVTLWEQAAPLGDPARVVLVTISVCMMLAFALLRPAGRLLEEWL